VAAATRAPQRPSPQGITAWFTGLPSAGKTTIANLVGARLADLGRPVEVLDGDVVRTHLSRGLGFSRADRDENIRRIGYVAGLLTGHGVTVLVSAISPYRAVRDEVRAAIGRVGGFVEVHVATDLATCQARDVKGLYARQARGELQGLTGVDDPYEPPLAPELVLDTAGEPPEASAERVRLEAVAEAERVRVDAIARSESTRLIGEAEAAATAAKGRAEGEAVQARGMAEAEAIKARADALAENQDAVIGQQLAEKWPAIVEAAAKPFGAVDQMIVLNGAQGLSEALAAALSQGVAGLQLARNLLAGGNGGKGEAADQARLQPPAAKPPSST
jgi:adenylylsulfate kinase